MDYVDPHFEERCTMAEDVAVPAPEPLQNLTWIHFPKYARARHAAGRSLFSRRWSAQLATPRRHDPLSLTIPHSHRPRCGTSLTSVAYHYLCQNTTNAPVMDGSSPDVKNYQARTCSYCYTPCLSCVPCSRQARILSPPRIRFISLPLPSKFTCTPSPPSLSP